MRGVTGELVNKQYRNGRRSEVGVGKITLNHREEVHSTFCESPLMQESGCHLDFSFDAKEKKVAFIM